MFDLGDGVDTFCETEIGDLTWYIVKSWILFTTQDIYYSKKRKLV